MSLYEIFKEGGFVMYPLLVCSIVTWAVVIEKIWFLKVFSNQFERLFTKAEILLKEQKLHEAKGLCYNVQNVISAPLRVVFEGPRSNIDIWQQRVGRRFTESRDGLRRFLWMLGTIGASAPFIGLFGTVVGIIKSFEDIASSGKSGFAVVASGLSEALIATAAGIVVAVIAVIFYNYFQVRLTREELKFKNKMEDLMSILEANQKE